MKIQKSIVLLVVGISPILPIEVPLKLPMLSPRSANAAVLFENLDGSKRYVFNQKRAGHRYSPASTFKILNTLIALQEKVLPNADSVIKWDGTVHDFPDWNKDQTLRTAFKASCVWFYQALAEKIGPEKYRQYLGKVKFGNRKTGSSVKMFWLDSSLQISAKEQIDFLKNLRTNKLSFEAKNIQLLKEVMLIEDQKSYKIFAKTGWVMQAIPQIGWYVGFIETKDDTWFFSINLDVHSKDDLKLRQVILIETMREVGISE